MLLKQAALQLFPPEFASVDWRDIWERPLQDGTAFQWSIVAALTRRLMDTGWKYKIPLIDFEQQPVLMTLRNEIPIAHLAQAGHSATSDQSVALDDRFMASLIPKLTFTKDGKVLSLFIEGCPYHIIATGQRYEIRPDILLLPGQLTTINKQGQMVEYQYAYSNELQLEGVLRVSSSRLLPLVQKTPPQDIALSVLGVVECSVNKSARVASKQIDGYRAVFQFTGDEGTFLITGNEITADCGSMTHVDLTTTNLSGLVSSLLEAGEQIRLHLVEPGVV